MPENALAPVAEEIRARVLITRETSEALEWLFQGVACEVMKTSTGWRTRVTYQGSLQEETTSTPAKALAAARRLASKALKG